MQPKNYNTMLDYHWFPSYAKSVYSVTPYTLFFMHSESETNVTLSSYNASNSYSNVWVQ